MKVEVIGCGSMGAKHINHLLELGHDVSICDINAHRLNEAAKKFKIEKKCEHFQSLLGLDNLDAVVVATDTAFHEKISRFFAQKGISYFSEIPISDSLTDLRSLATA